MLLFGLRFKSILYFILNLTRAYQLALIKDDK